jgi:ABC-type nitrate/sulfonate/bicarbonate transport system substrate-binding protein
VPIVSIATILQHNTSGFAAPKEKKIRSPEDFVGKTYGGWGTPIENAFIQTVLELDGIKADNVEDQVRIVNIGQADFFTAVKRDIDFSWIYYGWTGIEAELRNVPLDIIYLKDLDPVLDFYTPTIITNESMIQKDPETIKKFLRAVKKGYEYAIDHPEEAADILIEAVPESDPELIRKSQQWMSKQYRADAPAWGVQKEKVWTDFTDWMWKHKLIEKKIDPTKAFTNEFLPQ